jgi:hypothetical protein
MVVDSFEEAVSWTGLGMLVCMPIEFGIALYLDKRASGQRKKFLRDLVRQRSTIIPENNRHFLQNAAL